MLGIRGISAVLAGLALLASCGPAPAPETGASEEAKAAPCAEGVTPGLQLCGDAGAGTFNAVSSDHPLIMPKCVWRTQELRLAESHGQALYLVFRAQDCTAEGQTPDSYDNEHDRITTGAGIRILDIFRVPHDMDAKAFSLTKLDTAPEAERKRCIVRTVEQPGMPGVLWEIAPDDAFKAELEAKAEPYSACGEYGDSPPVHFWQARGGMALFHTLGFDVPTWDPASFTFYNRDADGRWEKLPD